MYYLSLDVKINLFCLKQNDTSWVVATAAALYWRVVGSGNKAVDCLRHALHYAPRHMKDIPLISLANVLHRYVFIMPEI